MNNVKIITSPSSRKNAKCNRLFNYNLQAKELGVREYSNNLKTLTGSFIHALLEGRSLGYNISTCREFAIESVPDYPKDPLPDKKWKDYNVDRVMLTYNAYCQRYPISLEPETFKFGDPELLEPYIEAHWVDNEPVGESLYRDQGYVDKGIIMTPEISFHHLGYQIDSDELWLMDHKSTSLSIKKSDGRTNPEWKAKFNADIQPALYMRSIRNNKIIIDSGMKIGGFCIDGIQHPKRAFERLWFKEEYTVEKCDEIIKQSDDSVKDAIENPDEPCYNHCNDYGGCEFWSLCHKSRYKNLDIFDRLPAFIRDKKELENEKND